MATVAIVPARYASERLPGKPLADIGGKPMIQHVCERAARAKRVARVIVATDDERIAAAVRSFGGEAVMTRSDLQSGSDRIAVVARMIPEAEIIVNVQGDEPLIEPEMIDEAVAPVEADRTLQVATLVSRITDPGELANPAIPKVVLDRAGFALYFSRAAIPFLRDLPPERWLEAGIFYRHVGLYVYRRDFLLRFASLGQTPLEQAEKLEQLRILEHGIRIKATVTSYRSISVDTPADLERVRMLVQP
jgi:3-deoxy-manno-octulosonate cytidylyltransferase (CMP-KDO synthetase)